MGTGVEPGVPAAQLFDPELLPLEINIVDISDLKLTS